MKALNKILVIGGAVGAVVATVAITLAQRVIAATKKEM